MNQRAFPPLKQLLSFAADESPFMIDLLLYLLIYWPGSIALAIWLFFQIAVRM